MINILKPINDNNSDFSLVYLKEKYGVKYPYCELHGAMLKVSKEGIWRCIRGDYIQTSSNPIKKNIDCRAGCIY